ncbi:hypothetical protein EYR36_005051 [Pleurotus pulmonarius]|nr:hypothetical protein EYR36_005051 [Pleurotus pulmonarius]
MLISYPEHVRGLSTRPSPEGDYSSAFAEHTALYRIPDGVLSHMFIVGQNHVTVPSLEGHVKTKSLPFELLVSHVNRRWRCVAIGTCSLWRRVAVIPEKATEETQTYLRRSKSHPTEIRVDGWPWEHPMPLALVAPLAQNIKCWRRAVINVSLEYPNHLLLDHLAKYPTILMHLDYISLDVEVVNYPPGYPTLEPGPIQILKLGTPRLEFVRLRGVAPQFFRPPMATVVTLHIELTKDIPFSYNTLKDLLTASPTLTNFSLYGDLLHFPDWPAPGAELIRLPGLKSLRLWGTHGWIYSNVLRRILAPALLSLYLKEVQETDLEPFWVSTACNNFPSLRELTFCDFDFSALSYYKAYAAFPHITKLTVLNTTFDIPIIVTLLGHRSANARIWPQLRELSVPYDTTDDQQLYDMVALRSEVRAPLSKLRICTDRPLPTLLGMVAIQRYVEVETFDEPRQWPEGVDHIDEDDVFFQ